MMLSRPGNSKSVHLQSVLNPTGSETCLLNIFLCAVKCVMQHMKKKKKKERIACGIIALLCTAGFLNLFLTFDLIFSSRNLITKTTEELLSCHVKRDIFVLYYSYISSIFNLKLYYGVFVICNYSLKCNIWCIIFSRAQRSSKQIAKQGQHTFPSYWFQSLSQYRGFRNYLRPHRGCESLWCRLFKKILRCTTRFNRRTGLQ